ncbi:hypothetical protein N7471_004418 [Penicillium samsonianum]|uniref:uncharacterized protein n=1 Tax=Penicillium samsonianum TaxID=1882272 RepID=UPI002548BE27|nr:uncharacterized protein N7471_004418 [Penicillium samsonianum]KAJ6137932.1 hypothetical protein N7471_004418 [Penicillium samsonianum]
MLQDLSGATESPRYTFLLISLSPKEPRGLINIQDVDVGTDIDCGELLLKRLGFIRSGDGRLAYDYRGTKCTSRPTQPLMAHPRSQDNRCLQCESWGSERRLNTSISIVHPSVLVLTKLKCWSTAEVATRQAYHQRTRTDLADIMTILRWLEQNKLNINFAGLARVPKASCCRSSRNFIGPKRMCVPTLRQH